MHGPKPFPDEYWRKYESKKSKTGQLLRKRAKKCGDDLDAEGVAYGEEEKEPEPPKDPMPQQPGLTYADRGPMFENRPQGALCALERQVYQLNSNLEREQRIAAEKKKMDKIVGA